MDGILIRRLDKGFVVMAEQEDRMLAGLSNGNDLRDWVSVWGRADDDTQEAADEQLIALLEADISSDDHRPAESDECAAKPPQEPQQSVAEAVAPEVPAEAESAPRERTAANAGALRADPDLTENQAAVLHHIERCAKPGERFQICMNTLAKHAGVSKGGVPFYLAKLKEAGFIDHEPPYGGDVFITRLKMEKAA